jgi:hypothetical protein
MSAGQIVLGLLGLLVTLIGAPIVSGLIQAFLFRTKVTTSAKRGTFFRPLSGEPFEATQVLVTNRSAHEVHVQTIGLQFYRLWPWPHWKSFTFLGHSYFKETLAAHDEDDCYFEDDLAAQYANENGWHRGPRIVRARVEVATVRPRYSAPIVVSHFGP